MNDPEEYRCEHGVMVGPDCIWCGRVREVVEIREIAVDPNLPIDAAIRKAEANEQKENPIMTNSVRDTLEKAQRLLMECLGDSLKERGVRLAVSVEIESALSALEAMERDYEAMNRLRSEKGCLQWAFGTWGHTVDFDVLRMNPRVEDPADAVLGSPKQSNGGEE